MKKHPLSLALAAAISTTFCILGGCASAPKPCPATDCPTCDVVTPDGTKGTGAAPLQVDLRDRTPQLDRSIQTTLEAFSQDGSMALLEINDSARGRSYRVVDLGTEKTSQTFELLALGEQAAIRQSLKALGKNPVTWWSQTSPAGDARAFVTEARGGLVLYLEAGAQTSELALLPRHLGADDDSKLAQPASVSAVTVAWAPDGEHIVVIYRQTTVEAPTIEADRWFSVPVRYASR